MEKIKITEEMIQNRKNTLENDGFNRNLGLKMADLSDGYCRIELNITEKHTNPRGEIHGGVLFSIADVAAGYAASTLGYSTSTVNSEFQFMRAGKGTKKIYGEGKVEKAGRTMTWATAEVFDENGRKLCMGTFLYINLYGLEAKS